MDQNGSLKANLFYFNDLHLIEDGNIKLSESIVNAIKPNSKTIENVSMLSKLFNHAADFNFSDIDLRPLPCNVTAFDALLQVNPLVLVMFVQVNLFLLAVFVQVNLLVLIMFVQVNLFPLVIFSQVNLIPLVMFVQLNLFTRFFFIKNAFFNSTSVFLNFFMN